MFFSCMDVAVDLIYLIDLLLNFRMGFLEEGILVRVGKLLNFFVVQIRKKNVMIIMVGSLKPQSQL